MAEQVRVVVVDHDALVRVSGSLDSTHANQMVVAAVCDAVAAGATSVVLDLAAVEVAGVELVTLLTGISGPAAGTSLVVLSPPKTLLLAVDSLRVRHVLDVREGPSR